MAVQERVYDIDDLWRLVCDADDNKRYELIAGEIKQMVGPGLLHGRLVTRLGRYLDAFAEDNKLGIVTTDTGFRPPDSRTTVLGPDVAFIFRGVWRNLILRGRYPSCQTWQSKSSRPATR